jgi:predicted metal-dependent hydrolase
VTDAATPPGAGRVIEGGRAKAYRPLPAEARVAAIARGLEAWERGEFYRCHEELEPAWMGTPDPGERTLISGLIKLAAAWVHVARGNALGMRTNLLGARERVAAASPAFARQLGLDLEALLLLIDDRLAAVEPLVARDKTRGAVLSPVSSLTAAPSSHDVAGPASATWRAPLQIAAFTLPKRVP